MGDMRGRVQVSALLGLAVVLGVVSTSSGEVRPTPRRFCTDCGTLLTQRGNGTLRITARGVTWGTVRQGQVVIRDRSSNGHRDWSVKGAEHRRHYRDGRWWYQGRNMTVYVSTRYSITIKGSGLSTSTVAVGKGYIDARRSGGSYHLNGGRGHRWPLAGRRLHLQR